MAKVTTIVNSRPLIPVSMDPDDPSVLTPTTLLTQTSGPCPAPPDEFNGTDLNRHQWKQVQCIGSTFWDRWQKQNLSTLQWRRKWQADKHLPLGRITKVFPSEDRTIHKMEIKVADKEGMKMFLRSITQVVTLLPTE